MRNGIFIYPLDASPTGTTNGLVPNADTPWPEEFSGIVTVTEVAGQLTGVAG